MALVVMAGTETVRPIVSKAEYKDMKVQVPGDIPILPAHKQPDIGILLAAPLKDEALQILSVGNQTCLAADLVQGFCC